MTSAGSTTARGYDGDHKKERRRLERQLKREGWLECQAVECVKPTRVITIDDDWDLDHTDDRQGYRGPGHARCNRRAGAIKGNKGSAQPTTVRD